MRIYFVKKTHGTWFGERELIVEMKRKVSAEELEWLFADLLREAEVAHSAMLVEKS